MLNRIRKLTLAYDRLSIPLDIEIQFYSPSMVRVLKSPEGTTFTKQSLSVIQVPQKTAYEHAEQARG